MKTGSLFFGVEVNSPWPEIWPEGRVIEEPFRHITIDFLGNKRVELPKIAPMIGTCGFFDQTIFPNSRCVSWHVHFLNQEIATLQKQISDKPWLPHLTVCRKPFHRDEWAAFFRPLPCFAKALHLYKSLGFSHYETLWSHAFLPPFEEIEHTADVAFNIFGINLDHLYENAFTALAFKHPPLVLLWKPKHIATLDEVIIALNKVVQAADRTEGCPFKAVSFHGEVKPFQQQFIQWEMIIDV